MTTTDLTPSLLPGVEEVVRVLVIDDDAVDRMRVRRMLSGLGVSAIVMEEEDPAVAITKLASAKPDVIVLDYNFPRDDGLSVLRDLKDIDPILPIIALTGQDDTAIAVELMRAGAADYVPKSGLTQQRLVQSMRLALRTRASEFAKRAAQEALRASEELARRILESTGDCIDVLDLEGRLQSMSPAGLRKLAIPDFSEIYNTSWIDLWAGDDRKTAADAVATARKGGSARFVASHRARNGRTIWWDHLITPILGSDGKAERVLCISRDVTDQRTAATDAELAQQIRQALTTSPDEETAVANIVEAVKALQNR